MPAMWIPPAVNVWAFMVLATGLSDEHITFIQIIVGGAVAVATATVTTMTWIDRRMDKKVNDSEARILDRINHLKELLVERGVIHGNHEK